LIRLERITDVTDCVAANATVDHVLMNRRRH
jgi:hypothetical protein